jgi:leucine-rich repeat protein SHOC2
LNGLSLYQNQLYSIPESIGNLTNLTWFNIAENKFTCLPEKFYDLTNLTWLDLCENKFECLPESIGNLTSLTMLDSSYNELTILPNSIGSLSRLKELHLCGNKLSNLPNNLIHLVNLIELDLRWNQFTILPKSIQHLWKLEFISFEENPLIDLSILQSLPKLSCVEFLNVYLPHRYWTKLSDWNPKWLIDEENAEVRRALIQQVGYDRICQELDAIDLDTWREYTLLKIDADIDEEPMLLLKMTCPSTGHIHTLRVPPEMTSAEAAITWVNHGIHPDRFIIQT